MVFGWTDYIFSHTKRETTGQWPRPGEDRDLSVECEVVAATAVTVGYRAAHRFSSVRRCEGEKNDEGRSMWTPISPDSERKPRCWTGSGSE